MILVDTSVWIRAFMNTAPFAGELDRLLSLDLVAGHIFVYGELLMGDTGGRRKFLTSYRDMTQAALVPHEEVIAFVESRKLGGRGLSWIDAHLLGSALISRAQLWTADRRLSDIAFELAVGYDPSAA
jgi:predicted nucleic acid-binding protein